MTRDELAGRLAARTSTASRMTPEELGIDVSHLPPPHLYAPGEVEALAEACAAEAWRRYDPAPESTPENYDALTAEERKARARSIAGSDAEDARRMREWDEAEDANEDVQPVIRGEGHDRRGTEGPV